MNLIKNLENLLKLNKNDISLIESDCFKKIDNIIRLNVISLFSYIEFNEPKDFVYKSIAVDSGISIEYSFNYGELSFLYIDDSIELKVTFNEKPKIIPSFNDYCYININENFEFQSLTFQKYFHIASIGFYTKNNSKQGFCFCSFRYKMNSDKSITKNIFYVNLNSGLNINLKNLGLLDIIFNFNNSLDELFFKLLTSLSNNPQLFYSVFENYPKQIDIVRDPIFLKELLEKAYLDYSKDIEQFNSKMLILKMGEI